MSGNLKALYEDELVEFDEEEDEAFGDIVKLIHYLEETAEHYNYIDDYKILVIDGSREPIIIMSPEEFLKVERRTLGVED